MERNKETANLSDKLNLLTNIIRIGHEAFKRENFISLAWYIANKPRQIVKYDRSCLIDMRVKKPYIIAVSNQSTVNQTSEYCIQIKNLISHFKDKRKITILDQEYFTEKCADIENFTYFKNQNEVIVIIPLPKLKDNQTENTDIFWIVEFFNNYDKDCINLLSLLSQHFREAVWYFLKERHSKLYFSLKKIRFFSPFKIFIYLFMIFVFFFFIKITQNVAATFELVPAKEFIEYAPCSGFIKTVNYEDGVKVKKGSTIICYNTKELNYNLSDAETKHNEILAELDWVKQKSFNDKKELGKVKILTMKLQNENINISKMKWFLSKAKIKAKASGILIFNDNDSEKLNGRVVKAGEKLFTIVPPRKIEAKVMLNEINAAVLSDNISITMYLHSSPETSITGKIKSISPKPILTETGQFCYIIKLELTQVKPNYIVGMRGIARISGEKVSIGYYLFKSIVLWWRKASTSIA